MSRSTALGRAGLLVGFATLSCSPTSEREEASLPGPALRRAQDLSVENRRCERCHVEIAAEWRQSMHRQSHDNPAYRRAFEIEPLEFCESCHAPEGSEELGVGCVSCHLPAGQESVLAAAGESSRAAPHRIQRSIGFSRGSGACAGCHEFEFPDRAIRERPEWMQRTVSEHRDSPFAEQSCASCHMPLARGKNGSHRTHDFSSTRSPSALAAAVEVTARRTGDGGRVVLDVRTNRVGHAFPTGDLFRRLRVSVEALGSDFRVLENDERYLARHFASRLQRSGRFARVEVSDDRPGADGTGNLQTHFDLGAAGQSAPIGWSVVFERVGALHASTESDAEVLDSVPLAQGVLEPWADSAGEQRR
jgi:hypothetical protein